MAINIIAACDLNFLIGLNGKLPWHIPADLKHFKELTMGHAVIMGRKTWESLGGKTLRGRTNIILSNTATYGTIPFNEVDVAGSLNTAIHHFAEYKHNCREIFIIGGAKLYEEALPIADRIYLTQVKDYIPVNPVMDEAVYFPVEAMRKEKFAFIGQDVLCDARNVNPDIAFQVYERRK